MDVTIRAYEERDRDAVNALISGVLAEYGFSLNMGGLESDLAEAHARYAGARAGFWVAEEAGTVIVGNFRRRPAEGRGDDEPGSAFGIVRPPKGTPVRAR